MRRCPVLVVVLALAHFPAMAQAPSRTPWGDPDLQGTWDFTTLTPLQRPPELAGKAFLTEEEAATLVVETRNLTDHGTGTFGLPGLTDRHARLVERFTRTGDRGLAYRFTITDPTVWSRPWSGEVPMTRVDGFVMEYACHEGNYGLANILAGARAEEKTVAKP